MSNATSVATKPPLQDRSWFRTTVFTALIALVLLGALVAVAVGTIELTPAEVWSGLTQADDTWHRVI